MYDHVGLKVKDLRASVRFYGAALSGLGYKAGSAGDDSAGFSHEDGNSLWLYAGKGGGGTHLAFQAPTREAVDGFHQIGLASGGSDNGAPGVRTDYSPTYYAAFLKDPDGNNVEAVCMS